MNRQKAEFEVLADLAKCFRQRGAIFNLKRHGGDASSIGVLLRYNRRDIRESLETLRQLRNVPKHRRRFVARLQFPAKPEGNSQLSRVTLDCDCVGLCYGHLFAEASSRAWDDVFPMAPADLLKGGVL